MYCFFNFIEKGCKFLVSKQREDGGWGEDFDSCWHYQWIENKESQVVHTAWCILSLLAAKYSNRSVIDKGIKFLMSKQLPNGDFPFEQIKGVFNGSTAISYNGYKNYFPIWALSAYSNLTS